MTDQPNARGRILVVEDEWLIADQLENALVAMGYDVVGPVPTVKEALSLIKTESLTAAVLDVDLTREKSFRVAEALSKEDIPYLFLTGYVSADLPADYRDGTLLSKPATDAALEARLSEVLARPRRH